MTDGRQAEQWDHTSHLMWMLQVVNAAGKVSSTPDTFNPIVQRARLRAQAQAAAKMDPAYVAAFEREMRGIEMKMAVKAAKAAQQSPRGDAP